MDVIVNFTATGMIPVKETTPFVPVSVSKIVEDIHAACEIGITAVHLHARDQHTSKPTYKAAIYAEIIEGIHNYSRDLMVCASLSGRTFKEFRQRAEPLNVRRPSDRGLQNELFSVFSQLGSASIKQIGRFGKGR